MAVYPAKPNCDLHGLYCVHKHSTKKPVTTMLTYPWKCTVLHCNHLGNTWKPLVPMTRHFDYCPSTSEYNVKLYISRGRLAWWLLAFLHSEKKYIGNTMHMFCESRILFAFFCNSVQIYIHKHCIKLASSTQYASYKKSYEDNPPWSNPSSLFGFMLREELLNIDKDKSKVR